MKKFSLIALIIVIALTACSMPKGYQITFGDDSTMFLSAENYKCQLYPKKIVICDDISSEEGGKSAFYDVEKIELVY